MHIKKRAELIDILNKVKCALTQNEILEQSNAFVFQDKKIYAFNGELFATTNYDIGITKPFAVIGADLLKVLEKFPEGEIKLALKDKELRIKGKNKRAGITTFEEIKLPYDEVPAPGKMKKIPNDFFHQLIQCARICGSDHTNPKTTHVYLGPKLIQATDRYRLFRVDMKTGIKNSILIPADTILSIGGGVKIKKIGIKDKWLHISTGKIRYSIRCSNLDYFEDELLNEIIKGKGSLGQFSKTIVQTLERASVMLNTENDVQVQIKKGMMKIRTEKDGGWYEEKRKIKYSGKPVSFVVNLNFLKDILSKTQKVIFGDGKIKIEEDNFRFVICTG